VEGIDCRGLWRTIAAGELQFDYRYSALQGEMGLDFTIIRAELQLQTGFDPHLIKQKTDQNFQQRHSTQPYHLPSCGSVFRNPYPQSAGRLIESAGLKGYTIGRAQVSTMHANFIVNLGGATAQQVYLLIAHVQGVIQAKYGISLHPEVKMLGDFS
jgi:UDP-N-acetylmuramate dehydrogenase